MPPPAIKPPRSRARHAPPLIYSADAHREFVSGFRRRKQQRRQQALHTAAQNEKENRLELRRQRRHVFKSNRRIALGSDSENDQLQDNVQHIDSLRTVDTYREHDAVVTAVVAPLVVSVPVPVSSSAASQHADDKSSVCANDSSTPVAKNAPTETRLAEPRLQRLISKKKKTAAGRRNVSYTHALSKSNRRKAKLRARRQEARRHV